MHLYQSAALMQSLWERGMPDHVRKRGGGEHWSVLHAPFLLYDSSEEAFRFYRSAPSQFLPSMPRYLAPGPPD